MLRISHLISLLHFKITLNALKQEGILVLNSEYMNYSGLDNNKSDKLHSKL